jgi:EmrB/QacA subfamily drug resistance transporter
VPLFGKISDLYGRKIVFQTAIVIFLVGSVLAGISQDMLQLVASRGIQGIGGGGLMAMTFTIVGDIVPPRTRGRYTGYLTGVFAASSVLGPLIGGFFVDNLSWRWVFFVNLPVGAVAMVATAKYLRLPVHRTERRVDYLGAALLVGAVSSLLLVSVWGGQEYEWTSPTILSLGVVGVVLGVVFLWHERRAPEPLLPLRLFQEPVFRVSTLLGVFIGMAMFGGIIFLPVFLQVATGASATRSGLLTLPLMAGLMASSVIGGRIISRTGRYKVFPIVGTFLASTGMFLLSTMSADTPRFESGFYMAILGCGLGCTMPVLTLAVQNAAPPQDLGAATSAVNFFRSLGGAFGVALFGAVLNSRLASELAGQPAVAGIPRQRLLGSPEAVLALPEQVQDVVKAAVASSVTTVFLVATPMLVIAFVLAWLLKELPLRETSNIGMAAGIEGAEEMGATVPAR